VSRCKSAIAIVAIILIATALAAVALPQKAEAVSLRGKLRAAKRALLHSTQRLTAAEAALATATAGVGLTGPADPSATPTPAASPAPSVTSTPAAAPAIPTVDELKAQVAKDRRAVHVWQQRVQRLAKQYSFQLKMADWERHAEWLPIIKVAAAKYHVKADGIYRMMMLESRGHRYAGSGSTFKGLFQYCAGTWAAAWNPYRHDSIYDGSAQIFATCYAVSRGMGPSMWTNTFASQY
jgi:hypothetical protein